MSLIIATAETPDQFPSRSMMLAFFAGLLGVLAFAPFEWYHFAIVAPALFCLSLRYSTAKQAALIGLSFGLGFFGLGVSWVFVSIKTYGGVDAWLAAVFTALFVFYCALYPALLAYCLQRFFPKESIKKYLLVFPALFVLSEYLRATLFTGFPWLLFGFSQTHSALSGYAPIIGVYGLSFLLCLISSCLLLLFIEKSYRALLFAGIIFCIWLLGASLTSIQWSRPVKQALTASLVQGNIAQPTQWDGDYFEYALKTYQRLTEASATSDIVVWPESAVPMAMSERIGFLFDMNEFSKKNNMALLLGVPVVSEKVVGFYNGLIALGQAHGHYYKRHLVPFGEYTPLPFIISPLFRKLGIPMSNLIAGPFQQKNIIAHGIHIAPYICYEIAYSNVVRSDFPEAEMLVTISNDDWFGHSFAPAQHAQMARMRAIQTARYHLITANTGISEIVSPKGKVLSRAKPFSTEVITHSVQALSGTTPWVMIGDWPILIFSLSILLIAFLL